MANKKPLTPVKKALPPRTQRQPENTSEPKDETLVEPVEDETNPDDVTEDDVDPADDNNTEEGEQEEQVDGVHQLSSSNVDDIEYETPPGPLDPKANPMVNQDADREVTDFGALPGAPKDSLVLGPDEDLRVDGDPSPDGTYIRLNKAVYRAKLPMGSRRWSFMLVYPANAQIPMSIVQPVQRDADAPTIYPYSAQP